jgi:hypothetical protein
VKLICQVGIVAREIPTRSCFVFRESEQDYKRYVVLGSLIAEFQAVAATWRFYFLWFHFHIY